MVNRERNRSEARQDSRAYLFTGRSGRVFGLAGFVLVLGLAEGLLSQHGPAGTQPPVLPPGGQPARRVRQQGPARTQQPVVRQKPGMLPQLLWRDPGEVGAIDFATGPGGKAGLPVPPFQFVEEDLGGSNPKVKVRDAQGRLWIVKWSEENKSEAFATRLVMAAGYFARPAYFVREGQIAGVRNLRRAAGYVAQDGYFDQAAFKLISDEQPYMSGYNWAWIDNPFLETPQGVRQLNGLKILMMLTSNWDAKDTRDARYGPNTAIYRVTGRGRVAQFLYAFDDWGATMGKWGMLCVREKWDCDGYARQTPHFVRGVKNGYVQWGFRGKHTQDIREGITVEDVRWLLQYLGQVTDRQLREGLAASGADPEEVRRFSEAIRQRIRQLEQVAQGGPRQERLALEALHESH